MAEQFINQVVLITGASRGIGAASAIAFAAEGAKVAINYRADEAGARDTLNESVTLAGRVYSFRLTSATRRMPSAW